MTRRGRMVTAMWNDARIVTPPVGKIVLVRAKIHSGRLAPYIARLEKNGTWSLQGWIYERAPIVRAWMEIPE